MVMLWQAEVSGGTESRTGFCPRELPSFPREPEGARSKMLQLQPSHHTDTINADVHTADVEWRRIDCWTLTQSGLMAGPVGPSLLIMTLITSITSNCKVNSVI